MSRSSSYRWLTCCVLACAAAWHARAWGQSGNPSTGGARVATSVLKRVGQRDFPRGPDVVHPPDEQEVGAGLAPVAAPLLEPAPASPEEVASRAEPGLFPSAEFPVAEDPDHAAGDWGGGLGGQPVGDEAAWIEADCGDGAPGRRGPCWPDGRRGYWVDGRGNTRGRLADPLAGWLGSARGPRSWFRHGHGDPDHPGRHVGRGHPLEGSSWLNRPYHASLLLGGLLGGDLRSGEIQQSGALLGDFRLGWDFDHYWGAELRAAFATPDVRYPANPGLDDASRVTYYDARLHYYPWGDARCRPYAALGLGLASVEFSDALGNSVSDTLLLAPVGVGFKYQFHPCWVGRVELLENLAIGSTHVDTLYNVSLSAGVEFHFGGKRKIYSLYEK